MRNNTNKGNYNLGQFKLNIFILDNRIMNDQDFKLPA